MGNSWCREWPNANVALTVTTELALSVSRSVCSGFSKTAAQAPNLRVHWGGREQQLRDARLMSVPVIAHFEPVTTTSNQLQARARFSRQTPSQLATQWQPYNHHTRPPRRQCPPPPWTLLGAGCFDAAAAAASLLITVTAVTAKGW